VGSRRTIAKTGFWEIEGKKVIFEDIIGKSSDISLAGGHTGPPLQRRENAFNKKDKSNICQQKKTVL
jgi:hypothetical protein